MISALELKISEAKFICIKVATPTYIAIFMSNCRVAI
jgi:hypothetical protein